MAAGPERPVSASATGTTDAPAFLINGRFVAHVETGVQRYAREITRGLDSILRSRGLKARFVTPVPPPRALDLTSIDIDVVRPFGGHVWEQTTLLSCRGLPLLNLCNTAPALGARNVVCIHDTSVFTAPESYSRSFRAFYKLLQPWICRRAIAVATVSEDAASQIGKHLGIPAGDLSILPNGHEHALGWKPDLSRFKGTSGRPYVLMIGSVARHKNIGRVIGLAEILDGLGLDIKIAGGSAGIFAQAEQRSSSNLTWLGRVSDDDLAFLLQNALCLAFPSISEGFGIPALEALVWGCPVVASGTSSLPEVCGDAALFADPGADAEWIARFKALVQSPELRETLRQKGFAQARKFSWAQSSQGYFDLLAEA